MTGKAVFFAMLLILFGVIMSKINFIVRNDTPKPVKSEVNVYSKKPIRVIVVHDGGKLKSISIISMDTSDTQNRLWYKVKLGATIYSILDTTIGTVEKVKSVDMNNGSSTPTETYMWDTHYIKSRFKN